MAGKILEIPFGFGTLVSVTPSGSGFVLWFNDYSGVIRGIPLDPSKPELQLDREIQIKRRTEGQTRKKKGALPPITAGSAAPPAAGKK